MSNPQQVNNRQKLCRDDEIDLFDLFKILWKWRLFIVVVTLSGLFIGFGYTLLQTNSPATYTAKVYIQIGKIANVNIENAGDIYTFLQSDAFIEGDERLRKIGISFNDFQDFEGTEILTLSYADLDAEKAKQVIQKALRTIQQRHGKTYTNALEKFEKFKPQLDKLLEDSARNLPFLWLDSYTYPTRIIKAVEVSKNEPADRTILTFALTTMAALFISIMLAFLIEGIRNRIEEEKYE